MKTSRNLTSIAVMGSAAFVFSSHAAATDNTVTYREDGRPTKAVSVQDLDLADSSDVQVLYDRMREAANAVCASEARRARLARDMAPLGWRGRCIKSAVDDAVRSFGDQRLTALHRGNRPEALIARR